MTLETGPLSVSMASKAYATPFFYNRDSGEVSGCFYDNKGMRIDRSLRTSGVGGDRVRNSDPAQIAFNPEQCRYSEGRSLYLGHIMGHYGHFITETISTFWAIPVVKADTYCFHHFLFGSKTQEFMIPFFDAFGIDYSKLLHINSPTIFEEVLIPERTFHLNQKAHKAHAAVTRHVCDFVAKRAKTESATYSERIFVSRSALKSDERSVANQLEVEKLFSANNFLIVHPEDMNIFEQIQMFRNAKIIAGFAGSGLHNCLYMNENSQVIELSDMRSPMHPLQTQILCCAAANIELIHIPFHNAGPLNRSKVDTMKLMQELRHII